MTAGQVYGSGWTLDDIHWDRFDPGKAEPALVAAVKAASLVEFNADAYVDYLKRVFRACGAQTLADIEGGGIEESPHGLALGRWGNLADSSFNFRSAFARFQAGYRPPHFDDEQKGSV